MKIAQRFLFYGIGFVFGLIILFFFLGGKKTSCDYGPDARVLKNIRLKTRIYSEESLLALQNISIDTSDISQILQNGDVNFSESDTDPEDCKIYIIEGEASEKEIRITVTNCQDSATIEKISKTN